MRIGLIDVDSHNFPNLALMKLSAFHRVKLDNVEWASIFGDYDRVYYSKIFTESKDYNYCLNTKESVKGGTGYDLKLNLPDEVNECDPDYSIYPQVNYSIQFFSRGCIRKCPFCVVPEKEGFIHSVKPMALNEKGEWIEVLDNSFFANPEWETACKLILEWNKPVNLHGVDVRILKEEHCYYLNKMKHLKQIHIAWDSPEYDMIPKLNEILKWIKPYKLMAYVLIGYWSTPEQDYDRVMKLNSLGIDPFVMPFDKKDLYQKHFARWVNHKAIFKSVSWSDYKPATAFA
jgi:hypothetical protein